MADPPRYIIQRMHLKIVQVVLQLRVQNKVVPVDAVPEVGNRCHVYVLDLYFKNLPGEAFKNDNFYLKPCSETLKDPKAPWFTPNPIGKNTLERYM